MRSITMIVGLAIVVLCAMAIVAPELLLGITHRLATPAGLYIAAAIRLAVGALLLAVAERSHSPVGFRVIGVVTLAAGIVTPFIGVERAQMYVAWWSERGDLVLRLWAASGLALGLYIVWGTATEHRPLRPVHH